MKTTQFAFYAAQYLEERQYEVAPSTFVSEKSKVGNLVKYFGKREIAAIRQSDIKAWKVKVHKRFANKTINEHFTVLRALFRGAVCDSLIKINPMDDLKNLEVLIAEPEPFSQKELLVLHNTETTCISGKNLFLLGVLTGLRISELIGLTWECIDFVNASLLVNKCRVLGDYKVPKTKGSLRHVELNKHALALLKKQFALTGSRKATQIKVLQTDNKSRKKMLVQHVFVNTKTNKPFIDSKQFGKTFFTPFLQTANVKHRGAGQSRHTFASQSLTAGISKEWLAQQLGHTGTKMIDKHYGRWLQEDAPDNAGRYADCLNTVFGIAPVEVPLSPKPKQLQLPPLDDDSQSPLVLIGTLLQAIERDPALLTQLAHVIGKTGGSSHV